MFKGLRSLLVMAAATSACTLSAQEAAAARAFTEPEIAQIVNTVNNGEVRLARLALRISRDSAVRAYAQHMINDHTTNRMQSRFLFRRLRIYPVMNRQATVLARETDAAIFRLSGLRGAAFNYAYIRHEIRMHRRVAALLSQSLIPSARQVELRSFLRTTYRGVLMHLNHARRVLVVDDEISDDRGRKVE